MGGGVVRQEGSALAENLIKQSALNLVDELFECLISD